MPESATTQLNLAHLFTEGTPRLQLAHGMRSVDQLDGLERLRDGFDGAECLFVRADSAPATLALDGQYKVEVCPGGGWLVVPGLRSEPTYWLPRLPIRRELDEDGHIRVEEAASIEGVEAAPSRLALRIGVGEGILDFVVWRLNDLSLVEELGMLTLLEEQIWYLWGSHTTYSRPADLYKHLIHGHIYENRVSWPFFWKICSENDAHALYVILTGLYRATGKRLYDLLRTQVVLSVVDRLGKDGAFRHGEWSKDMESHYRLHASGMHLMMDYLAERRDPVVADALARAAAFLASRPDRTALGAWFLHDDLEQSVDAMARSPFAWEPGRALGKSPSNMLVLNTHLDTLVGLDRFAQQAGKNEYADLIRSAVAAARGILAQRPAEWLYGLIAKLLYLTFLPKAQAGRLPLHLRALKRFGWKWLAPRLHRIKTAFPRLVMPGGYVDRAVSLKGVSDAYQSINLMDLLRFVRRFPSPEVDELIHEALAFTRHSGLLGYWQENPKKAYALGFWAESLWHACLLYPHKRDYREALAEAMLLLEATQQGQPPSFFGANAEAVPVSEQIPCPSPADARLRVANISRGKHHELLVVNPTEVPVLLAWQDAYPANLLWRDQAGRVTESVPPHGWLLGTMTEAVH